MTLRVSGVVKRYPLFARRRDRLAAFLGVAKKLVYRTVLDHVDLEARAGDALGIIGENGSGKSTLLRLISGISEPEEGEIQVSAPVAPILELGLGFHPDFTGRENAVFYGSLLGLSEELVAERLERILAFAELGDSIDQPLRTYSSGMAARLAFAVATNVDPKVLVVDEALAVGDGAFQKKCVDRMARFKEEGRTVLFCSHALYLVTTFCQRAVWLHHGCVRSEGPAREVVDEYQAYLLRREASPPPGEEIAAGSSARAPVHESRGWLEQVRVSDASGHDVTVLPSGAGVEVEVAVRTNDPSSQFHVGVTIDTAEGRCLLSTSTLWDGLPPLVGCESYRVRLHVPSLPFGSGRFSFYGFLFDETGLYQYDQMLLPQPVTVTSPRWTGSVLILPHDWIVSG